MQCGTGTYHAIAHIVIHNICNIMICDTGIYCATSIGTYCYTRGIKGLPKICWRKSDLQSFRIKTLQCGLIVHHYTLRGPSLCLCLYLCNCICICFHICICTAQPPCSVAPWWSGLSALALDQLLIV